jgi:hypothetical protein
VAVKRREKLVFHSMEEFRDRYFPNERKHRIVETPEDARALGEEMARESMRKLHLKFK